MKKIAIIGTGIAALTTAYKLKDDYEIQLFDVANYVGGHTNTISVKEGNQQLEIDTGFIVFNEWTYPRFIELMNELGVESQPSQMSFSVKCDTSGLEYNGTNTNSLFAQRSNLFRPSFWGMVMDILRFNREAIAWLDSSTENDDTSLGQFIDDLNLGAMFRDKYIMPMTAAIWSAGRESVLNFPLRFYLNFFRNHGFLSVDERPVWRVIKGGSKSYIPKLTAGFEGKIHLNCPIHQVKREDHRVTLVSPRGSEDFDGVVFACHSNQALQILEQPSALERRLLEAIPYQSNTAILHTDEGVLPKRQLARAAWNYNLQGSVGEMASLTYNMNILQNLQCSKSYNVTLNYSDIDPEKVIRKMIYEHPVFTLDGVSAQKRHSEISGVNRSFYAGAYWRYGFHEDGVVSGLRAAQQVRDLL